jgi:hypothetical protein
MNRRALIPTAAALAAVALVPASALAKPAPLYSVSITGSQTSIWSYGHAASGFCDANVDSKGTQIVRFTSPGKIKLRLHTFRGHRPYFAAATDPVAKYGVAQPIGIYASAEREATETSNTPDGDKCRGTGSTDTTIPRDCGDRIGRLDMKFGWDYSTRSNYLRLGGHYQSFTVGTLANFVPPMGSGLPLGQTFRNCGFWAPTVSNPGVDELLEAEEPIKPKRILGLRPGKSVRISGDFDLPYWDSWKDAEHDGKSAVVWNATIKRLK